MIYLPNRSVFSKYRDCLTKGGGMKKEDDAKFLSEKAKGYFKQGFN